MKKTIPFAALALCALAACVSDPALEAFDGDFDREKETKIIVTYCQSCHNHAAFDPVNHLATQPSRYTESPYADAQDCRTCHDLRKNFWHDYVRSTRFPDGSLIHE
ncbi:MAG: hypothetical protein HQK87_05615 [Nitrospinae bacterium]|nr:hypothetical protein [Nitrospinota bacterium]